MKRGQYVQNVHPCSRYDDYGIVLAVESTLQPFDTVRVQTGTGSTCYGPAANWQVVDTPPRWYREETMENVDELEATVRAYRDEAQVTGDYKPYEAAQKRLNRLYEQIEQREKEANGV